MTARKSVDVVRPDAEIIATLRTQVSEFEKERAALQALASEATRTADDLRVRLKNAERDLAGARTERDEARLQVQRAMGYVDRILEQERENLPPSPQPAYNYPTQQERGPRLDRNHISVPF